MLIKSIEIKNYKQLKDTKIYLNDEQSIFVGANNSGKTSAIQAISNFLSGEQNFGIYDFTLSNWPRLNQIFDELMRSNSRENEKENETIKNKLQNEAANLFPSMKVILQINEHELYHVQELIPTLNTEISSVAVYYRFDPKSYENLFEKYVIHRTPVENLKNKYDKDSNERKAINELWPKDFKDFLTDKKILKECFTVNIYQANPNDDEEEYTFDERTLLEGNPLKNVVRIDIINAQRGLTDLGKNTNAKDGIGEQSSAVESLSSHYTKYYQKFINPKKQPLEKDIDMIKANYDASESFKQQLNENLNSIIEGLYKLGYPGFGSPDIKVVPNVNMIDSIEGDSSILFNTDQDGTEDGGFYLPEHHNGLGFQNLISMFFKLTYFKEARKNNGKDDDIVKNEKMIAPLHFILIEEPEAHLHAQAQKVFVDKAYEILKDDEDRTTQLVMSTHSTHITHNTKFKDLIYFKRKMATDNKIIETEVVNLNNVFSAENEKDERFVEQYLKIYDHDLFFADGVILIEGAGERILMPKFIRESNTSLSSKYITILEMGGSHAHRLFPLLRKLERPTLIITDIDSVTADKGTKNKVINSHNYKSANSTINKWRKFSDEQTDITIKFLLGQVAGKNKIDGCLRLAYQSKNYGKNRGRAYARTFEDAIALSNVSYFSEIEAFGLSKKFKDSINENSAVNANLAEALFKDIKEDASKSNFALDLLFYDQNNNGPNKLKIPKYIEEGLHWLDEELSSNANNSTVEDEVID